MKWLVLALAFVMLTGATPGDGIDEARQCGSIENNPDLNIQFCTRAINSGELSTGKLVSALIERGRTYHDKRQYDRAIADYDSAIRLSPNNIGAIENRGLAYEKKGRLKLALRDFRRAYDLGYRGIHVVDMLERHGLLP